MTPRQQAEHRAAQQAVEQRGMAALREARERWESERAADRELLLRTLRSLGANV